MEAEELKKFHERQIEELRRMGINSMEELQAAMQEQEALDISAMVEPVSSIAS